MTSPTLTKNFTAGGAIPARRIVKPHSAAGQVVAGAASTDKTIGVSTILPVATGERVDVILAGVADVTAGGNVAAGDLVTSDSQGRAVVANPGSGTNARVVGVALEAGALGDFIAVQLSQGQIRG